MNKTDLIKPGEEIVEKYKHDLAEAINCLDRNHEIFEAIAADMKWNDDITWLITEAKANIGTALAALETWHDDFESETEEITNADHRKQRGRTAPNR